MTVFAFEPTGPDGRTAVVTGAASGIGAQVARTLAARGARVVGIDRPQAAYPHDVADLLAADVRADLSRPDGPVDAAARVGDSVGILVHCAGVAATRPWREVVAINTLAPRDLTRLLAPRMAQDPAVVAVASQAGFRWRENYGRAQRLLAEDDWDRALATVADVPDIQAQCYGISKEALIVHTLGLAAERPAPGLRANAVSPGVVDTPLLPDFTTSMGAEAINGSRAWAGRHARPDDVADVIAFLCSPDARWVNGAEIPVDGGYGAMVTGLVLSSTTEAAR